MSAVYAGESIIIQLHLRVYPYSICRHDEAEFDDEDCHLYWPFHDTKEVVK